MAQSDAQLLAAFHEKAKLKSAYQLAAEGWFSLPTAKRLKDPAQNPTTLRGKVREQVVAYLEGKPLVNRNGPTVSAPPDLVWALRELARVELEDTARAVAIEGLAAAYRAAAWYHAERAAEFRAEALRVAETASGERAAAAAAAEQAALARMEVDPAAVRPVEEHPAAATGYGTAEEAEAAEKKRRKKGA